MLINHFRKKFIGKIEKTVKLFNSLFNSQKKKKKNPKIDC